MYETHFGLKKRPFRALALGNDVFVGPQSAATMAAIKKALATPDAIAAVTGPVGGGKTTVVGRALDGLGKNCIVVPVGRIKLGTDEVLELLLGELGVDDMPASTVQRFTMFRRMLSKFADEDSRVVVVVEDAARIGVDSLSELEALTAADAGVSEGASVVLMGDDALKALLDRPELARVKQRLRIRQRLAPLAGNELHAYFKHCFRLAGGEFDSLFVNGAAVLVHELSGGIPRMANNLVESALAAAAEAGDRQISDEHIRNVAASEFGLELPEPELAIQPAVSGTNVAAPATENAEPDPADDIPELIQDTLPDLEVLAPQLTGAAAEAANTPANVETEPALVPDTPAPEIRDDIPTLTEASSRPATDIIPDWERDPTLAELRPDLDALEHAMAVAQGVDDDDEEDLPVVQAEPQAKAAPEVVPEITLDREIQAKIEEAAEAIKRTEEEAAAKAAADAEAEKMIDIAATGEIEMDLPELPPLKPAAPEAAAPEPAAPQPAAPEPAEAKPAEVAETPAPAPKDIPQPVAEQDTEDSTELKQIAANLSRARTIDDVDDKMAETLFGEEFSEIAAQVAAKAAAFPANDELELEEEPVVAKPAPAGNMEGSAAVSVSQNGKPVKSPPQLDEAASKRLETVRALNGTQNSVPPVPASAETIVMSHEPPSQQPASGDDHPQSIEDQINTSMTATLQALKTHPPHDHEDDDEGRKGFFSRFRRS
jgi:type II secretory pathway predicted ATPase ExeA